jgi:DNA-binding beta-propeller fold protein YncE
VAGPSGYQINDVIAGPSNRSFVLVVGEARSTQTHLYLLRFDPARGTTTLTRLPIPGLPYPAGLALSPDGTQVAVALQYAKQPQQLRIYSLTGHLIRQWQEPGLICYPPVATPCLSWAADGRLAFKWARTFKIVYQIPVGWRRVVPDIQYIDGGIFVIDASARSGSLKAASRLVVPNHYSIDSSVLSGDGRTIATVVDVALPVRVGHLTGIRILRQFEEVSATTGKVISRPWPPISSASSPGPYAVYWSNASGSRLIVQENNLPAAQSQSGGFGVLAGRRFAGFRKSLPVGLLAIAF